MSVHRVRTLCLGLLTLACCSPVEQGQAVATPNATSTATAEATTTAAANTAPAGSRRLAFDWKVGCSVPVKESRQQGKDGLEVSLVLRIAAGPNPTERVMHFEQLKLLSANGRPVPEKDASAAAASIQAPAVVFWEQGARARALDLDGFLKVAAAASPAKDLLTSPAARASVEFRALERWRIYAGFWVGVGLEQPKHKLAMPQLDGTISELNFAVEASSVGSRWQLKAMIPTEEKAAALAAVSKLMADAVATATAGAAPTVKSYQEQFEIDVAPSGFRVESVRHQSDLVMTAGEREIEQHKLRSASFDWARATGCD